MLRHLLSCQTRMLRASNQRRWAQVHDVRFLATTQQPTRTVLEKYREKLERKAREEGLPDIDALKAAYKDKIEQFRKETDRVVPPGLLEQQRKMHELVKEQRGKKDGSVTGNAASQAAAAGGEEVSPTGVKPLSAILDLPKASALPTEELSTIWRVHHQAKPNSLCAVIPARTFEAMETLAKSYPQFVLPVPHPDQGGAEMHFLQWTWDAATRSATVLFTQLAEYKARGEFAVPHTTVTHYKDLAQEKGVVLMQGMVMDDRGVKVDDARWLVMCLQRFYGGWELSDADGVQMSKEARERAGERRKLLEWFGKGDTRFSVEKLMEEAEKMG